MHQNCLIIIRAGSANGTTASEGNFVETCPALKDLMHHMIGYMRWRRTLFLRTVLGIRKKRYGSMERWKPCQDRLQIFLKILRGKLQDKVTGIKSLGHIAVGEVL